jgi:electron transfer flavoprotein alpha subunit
MANGILVAAEVSGGAVASITLEVLGAARRLADQMGKPAQAALVGSGVEGLAKELIAHGADQVFVVDEPALAKYSCDGFVAAMEKVNAAASPDAILMGQSDMGRDLGPRLAFRLGSVSAMDCLNVTGEGGKVIAERPCYGGNARATYSFNTSPAVISIRSKAQEPVARDDSRQGQVTKVDAGIDASAIRDKIVGHQEVAEEGIRLEDADVIVAGGRGIGSAEGFSVLEELAKALGGAVGATRAACDNGWRPVSEQIGLTGKIVGPTLYFAVGISGASQHMAGCSGAKNIVAINKDPEAIVFKSSRFGIVDDYKKVLPALVEACRKLKA